MFFCLPLNNGNPTQDHQQGTHHLHSDNTTSWLLNYPSQQDIVLRNRRLDSTVRFGCSIHIVVFLGMVRLKIMNTPFNRDQFVPHHVQGVLLESMDYFVIYEDIGFPTHIKIDVDGVEK